MGWTVTEVLVLTVLYLLVWVENSSVVYRFLLFKIHLLARGLAISFGVAIALKCLLQFLLASFKKNNTLNLSHLSFETNFGVFFPVIIYTFWFISHYAAIRMLQLFTSGLSSLTYLLITQIIYNIYM